MQQVRLACAGLAAQNHQVSVGDFVGMIGGLLGVAKLPLKPVDSVESLVERIPAIVPTVALLRVLRIVLPRMLRQQFAVFLGS